MNYSKLLDGKRAFISTGSQGIGLAIAVLFAQHGAKIALGGRNVPNLEKAIKKVLEFSPDSKSYVCDLSDESSINSACDKILQDFGGIDILVNVPGVNRRGPIHEYCDEDFDLLIRTNYKSAIICMKRFIPGMLEREYGNIIQISSIHSELTMPTFGLYAGTKGALNAVSRAAALDYAKSGIRVNAISPGLIMSDNILAEIEVFPEGQERDDFLKLLNNMQPLPPGKSEDVANAALYLASDMSSYVTGQSILVDGGTSIKGHP